MTPGASRQLTERQVEVMKRIDRRLPIKLIARDLGVSETRINQHIRALKDIYEVTNLGDLVLEYRAEFGAPEDEQTAPECEQFSSSNQIYTKNLKAAHESSYRFPQLPADTFDRDLADRDTASTLEFQDVTPMLERAPWLRPGEPKVVPGVLDGEHAVLLRLAVIIGIAFGFLAAVVLTVTAAIAISEALNGRANIPVDQRGFA